MQQPNVGVGIVGVFPDGTGQRLTDVLIESQASREEIARLRRALLEAQAGGASADDLAQAAAAQGPRFRALAEWMKSESGIAVGTWLQVLLTTLALLLPYVAPPSGSAPAPMPSPAPPPTVNISVNVNIRVTQQEISEAVRRALEEAERPVSKPPKNR